MIRVVLAVAVTTVLVATSLQAVDTVRADRTKMIVEGDLDRLDDAVTSVSDRAPPVPVDTPGTKLVVDLVLPASTWTTAPATFTIDGSAPRGHRVRYRVAGGMEHTVPFHGDFTTPDGPLILDAPGRHRLVVRYETIHSEAVAAITVAQAR